MDIRQSILSAVPNEPQRQWIAQQLDAHPPLPGQTRQQWFDWRGKVAKGMSERDALVLAYQSVNQAQTGQKQGQASPRNFAQPSAVPSSTSVAAVNMQTGQQMLTMGSGATASSMQNGYMPDWQSAQSAPTGSFGQMPTTASTQMSGQGQYGSYGMGHGGYMHISNNDYNMDAGMPSGQQVHPQHFGSAYTQHLSSPERQTQDLSAVLRGPEARAFSAQAAHAAQPASSGGFPGQGQTGAGGEGYGYPNMQNTGGGFSGDTGVQPGAVMGGGGIQMNDIAPRPTSGSPSALFGRSNIASASASPAKAASGLQAGSMLAPIEVDDGDGRMDVNMDVDDDDVDNDDDAEGEDYEEDGGDGGSQDAEGETDAGDSRVPSRNNSPEPEMKGGASVKSEREGSAMDVDDDPLNIIDQTGTDVKPNSEKLGKPGFASTHWTFTYPTSGINVNIPAPQPDDNDTRTGAIGTSADAGVVARWDPFPRLPVRRPTELPLKVGPKSFNLPMPSYLTSPFATDFDLDRLAMVSTLKGDIKPMLGGDGNAVAGPSKLSSPSKPSKPLLTGKPKRPRDSSSISHPSAPPSRTPPPSRLIASPHVKPPKAKEPITMSYLRQYLNPLHLKTAKPSVLWQNFRLRGKDRDEPPLYEPTPGDVREIMIAMNKATYDYKKALADNYDYSEVVGRWLGYMKGGLKEWEVAVGPTINFLAETDMPVNFIKHLKIAARIKSIKKMAEQQELGLDPLTKKAISATFANYASWLKSRIEPGNRTLPIPDYGLDSSDEEDDKAAKAKAPLKRTEADAQGIKKRKLSDTIPNRLPSPGIGSATTARGASHSPALPTTSSTSAPVKSAVSSSFVPRTTPSSKLSVPPPKPSATSTDIAAKRPKPNPTSGTSTAAYVPRTPVAVPQPAARASLLATTLAKPALGAAAGPAATAAGAPLTKSATSATSRPGLAQAGSNAQVQSNFLNLAEPAKKPNKKGHVVKWKPDAELEGVREFRQEAWELEPVPWGDPDDIHGISSHQLDINEGMTLKREMFDNCEEAEEIDWYNPELIDGAPDLRPPTEEVQIQEQRERAILASPGGTNADEKGVRVVQGRANVVLQPMFPSPDPVFTDSSAAAPAATIASNVAAGLSGTQSVAALLSSLGPSLLPGLGAAGFGQQPGGLGSQGQNQFAQVQPAYGSNQNQAFGGGGGGNSYGYGNQQPEQQSADPWGPQTYGQPTPTPYCSSGNHYPQQQQQQYPYQQQQRSGYEAQDNYSRSYGNNNDQWGSGQGGGWGGQGGGGGGYGGGQNQGQNQQGRNGQGRQGKKVCDYYPRGSSCDHEF